MRSTASGSTTPCVGQSCANRLGTATVASYIQSANVTLRGALYRFWIDDRKAWNGAASISPNCISARPRLTICESACNFCNADREVMFNAD